MPRLCVLGRADRVLVFFDAHKLDISDEFKSVLRALDGHMVRRHDLGLGGHLMRGELTGTC